MGDIIHDLYGIIRYANNKGEALASAREFMYEMVRMDIFDWCAFFDEPAATDAYGHYPLVMGGNTKIATMFIEDRWHHQRSEDMEYIAAIREYLQHATDEQAFNNETIILPDGTKNTTMFRHYAYMIGQYQGSEVRLYDQDGEGIRDDKHLKFALNYWEGSAAPPLDRKLSLFIVPVFAHY